MGQDGNGAEGKCGKSVIVIVPGLIARLWWFPGPAG